LARCKKFDQDLDKPVTRVTKLKIMKKKRIFALALIIIIAALSSCRKQDVVNPTVPGEDRKLRFQLYTNKDIQVTIPLLIFPYLSGKGAPRFLTHLLPRWKFRIFQTQ
jgi:hypothetical protein